MRWKKERISNRCFEYIFVHIRKSWWSCVRIFLYVRFSFKRICVTINIEQKFSQKCEAVAMKINLEVIAAFDLDGNVHPKAIVWEDGWIWHRPCAGRKRAISLKAGGLGVLYTCRIQGKEVKLFNDEGHWFFVIQYNKSWNVWKSKLLAVFSDIVFRILYVV